MKNKLKKEKKNIITLNHTYLYEEE